MPAGAASNARTAAAFSPSTSMMSRLGAPRAEEMSCMAPAYESCPGRLSRVPPAPPGGKEIVVPWWEHVGYDDARLHTGPDSGLDDRRSAGHDRAAGDLPPPGESPPRDAAAEV